MKFVKSIQKVQDKTYNVLSVTSNDVKYIVTPESCACIDYKSMMGLPCRHILKIRSMETLDLFHDTLCKIRCLRKYFKDNHRQFRMETNNTSVGYENSNQSSITNDSNLFSQKGQLQPNIKIRKIFSTVTSGALNRIMEMQNDKMNDSFHITSSPFNGTVIDGINYTVKSDIVFENNNSQTSKQNKQSDCCGNVNKVDPKLDLVPMNPKHRLQLKIKTQKTPPTVTSGVVDLMQMQRGETNVSFCPPKEVKEFHTCTPMNSNIQNVINNTVKSDIDFENNNSQTSYQNKQSDCCGNVNKVDQKLD